MSASEWPRDAYMAKQHRCEIAREPSRVFEPVAPKCGARARWWSDDLASVTVWMCDECCAVVVTENDGVRVEEVES